jgi:hypothetical protein
MITSLKILAVAGLLTAAATLANAGPASLGTPGDSLNNGVILVHGNHRACERDRHGWHRHNRFGERRPCRVWHGRGRRPDYCVRVGPLWYCDY